MARLCPLASGSSGNCTYISSGESAVIIDAGIPYKTICERVAAVGGDISKISGIALTHTHDDHIKGLKTLLQKTGAPLFCTKESAEHLTAKNMLPGGVSSIITDGERTSFADMEIFRFAVSHDAPGSCGYRIATKSGCCAVCTDSGIITENMRTALLGCDVVLLEFNHDIDMLRRGPYPPHLKIRILSDLGHLSNNAASAEIPALLTSGTKQIICGHISRQNNTPQLAVSAARIAAESVGAKVDIDYLLSAAKPGMSEVSVF
ncbi:MAG: MBL fold metallo-hydrolase [Clostridia bacterium]|nr:MBL fold metallo-hydrolase [Clostridia bacterium]